MKKYLEISTAKSMIIGSLAAVLVFISLNALKAQSVLTVQEVHRSARTYVGTNVQINGLAYNIRSESKNQNGVETPYTKFNLYEADSKGRKGKYYVAVSLPSSSFKINIVEGGPVAIVGTLKWPYQIAMIDE